MKKAVDLVGDIHGQSDEFEQLLFDLGYGLFKKGYRHPERMLIMVGDLIDGTGSIKGQRRVVEIARSMVEEGDGIVVMGNHEFNAICFTTPMQNGEYVRPHSEKNRCQHELFLAANNYLMITLAVVALWLLTLPFWESFVRDVMGINNASEVIYLVIVMIGFYVVFAFNNVIDSYFYGIGRTDLMLYQSLIVNTLFYGAAFISYQLGWFMPSLDKVAVMFGLGITLDALITWFLYRMVRKQTKAMVDDAGLAFS